jgi:hypothetical protein
MTKYKITLVSKYKTSITPLSNIERKMTPPSNWPIYYQALPPISLGIEVKHIEK